MKKTKAMRTLSDLVGLYALYALSLCLCGCTSHRSATGDRLVQVGGHLSLDYGDGRTITVDNQKSYADTTAAVEHIGGKWLNLEGAKALGDYLLGTKKLDVSAAQSQSAGDLAKLQEANRAAEATQAAQNQFALDQAAAAAQ